MILMIRFPWSRTHVAETFAASACHEVATHRSLHCLVAPRTDLSILGNPFGIGLLTNYLLGPFGLLLARARVMIIALAAEAKNFPTSTGYRIELSVDADAIATINPSTKLVLSVGSDEHLTQLLLVLFQPLLALDSVQSQHAFDCLEQYWMRTIAIHAARKRRAALNAAFQMPHPAFQAVIVAADVEVNPHILHAAHLAGANHSAVEAERRVEGWLEPRLSQIFRVIVVVLFAQEVLIPLELLEQDEAPPLVQADQPLHFFKDLVEFCVEAGEGEDVEGMLLSEGGSTSMSPSLLKVGWS